MSLRFTDTSEPQTAFREEPGHFYDVTHPDRIVPSLDFQAAAPYNQDHEQPSLDDRFPAGPFSQFNAPNYTPNPFPPMIAPPEPDLLVRFDDPAQGSTVLEEIVPDSFLDICMILTLPSPSQNLVWNYLNLLVNVTQNYAKDPLDETLPPQNSAQTSQQLMLHSGSEGRHLKEMSMRINIKNTARTQNRIYQFQLVCTIAEDDNIRDQINIPWDRMEVCTIVTNRSTNQLLRPITTDILRDHAILRTGDNDLGSFAFDGQLLYHVSPTPIIPPPVHVASIQDKVITVDKKDRILETRKARAGRPTHRLTKKQLVTRQQAEKIIEIRARWRGLTARQRRSHVTEADFYPFLTLNRDEVAEVLTVCATWFKDIIRLHGIKTWPGRPLRKTGARLVELKENLISAKAAIQFVQPQTATYYRHESKIQNLEAEVERELEERLEIVKTKVSTQYFEKFLADNGKQYLNPEWDTITPPPLPKYK